MVGRRCFLVAATFLLLLLLGILPVVSSATNGTDMSNSDGGLWSALSNIWEFISRLLFFWLPAPPTAPPRTDPPSTTPAPIGIIRSSPAPTTAPYLANYYCTCQSCTDTVWNRLAAGNSCGDRIQYLARDESHLYPTETDACFRVADIEYPDICGSCNPSSCDDRTPPPPERNTFCGCNSCTREEWKYRSSAEALSCEARATWLLTHDTTVESEANACRTASCLATCNTDTCNENDNNTDPTDEGLYCFPPDGQDRVTYQDAWSGDYVVQVKEDTEPCGPGGNRFSRDTVNFDTNNNLLTLRFEYREGNWIGSEVRVLLPGEEPFYTYGTFEFSVVSILLRDTQTNAILSKDELPISLVLGLFTWDTTDNFLANENWNHEVDIEISRWNDADNPHDAQFLVQPVGQQQLYRFSTGSGLNERQPGGHRYSFTWNPGQIDWSTDAGGGHSHSYLTQQAVREGRPDYVQCLPANVEVRMNLWNLYGANQPTGMETNQSVEVVIDDFSYAPSGLTFVAEGGYCSKDCQCETACVGGFCVSQ